MSGEGRRQMNVAVAVAVAECGICGDTETPQLRNFPIHLGQLCDECAPLAPDPVLQQEPVSRPVTVTVTLQELSMPRYARGSKQWEEALLRCMRLQRKSFSTPERAEASVDRSQGSVPLYMYECVCGGYHVTPRRQEADSGSGS
jgi:hypothetical protein